MMATLQERLPGKTISTEIANDERLITGLKNRAYQLVSSSNLVEWTTNDLSPDPATGDLTFTNALLDAIFSRLRASLPPPE